MHSNVRRLAYVYLKKNYKALKYNKPRLKPRFNFQIHGTVLKWYAPNHYSNVNKRMDKKTNRWRRVFQLTVAASVMAIVQPSLADELGDLMDTGDNVMPESLQFAVGGQTRPLFILKCHSYLRGRSCSLSLTLPVNMQPETKMHIRRTTVSQGAVLMDFLSSQMRPVPRIRSVFTVLT
jgi:hypothetical protein